MRIPLSILATAITLLTLATPTISAQELAVAPPGSPRLTFDIIVIHPANPDDKGGFIKPMPSGHGYLVQNIPVRLMISLMYKVPERQITGGPLWLDTERFDIEAKADNVYNVDDLHTMFQDLLADRFNLKFHVEKKEGNIYALTIDSSGLKMKPNLTPEDYAISVQPTGFASITGTRVTMNYLCWQLGQFLQNDARPVINFTGLTGNYDFKLEFLPPDLPPGVDKASLPPGFLDRPNIFTAVREQLGLKLKAQKGPVTYFVIDHIDKPTEN